MSVTDGELDRLRSAIADAETHYLADLERLVNIDCGTYSPAGVNEVGRWTGAFLAGLGATVEARPDPTGRHGDTIVATMDGTPGAPRVLLIGHLDTVFEDGTAAARPFRIDDGIARGPGVTDMKAGLLAGLYAIGALLEEAGTLPFERLTFVANPDEEVGSPSSTPHIRAAAADADAAFVLECARENGDIVSARKGMLDARIVVHGRAAHAGVEPERGRSAILEAARIVGAVHELTGRWPGVTANVGAIRGGTRPNIVPDRCELDIDVRSPTADGLDAAASALRELVAATSIPDTAADMTILATWRPMERLERSARLVEHATAIAARLGFDVADAATGGASDANTTSGLGVPTLDGLGPVGGNDHSPAEYLEVASVVPRTSLLAGLLLAVARDPEILAWRSDRSGPAR